MGKKCYLGIFAKSSFLFVSAVMAASAIANIVKSSLGPVGLDKMLVDEIGVCVSIINIHRRNLH